ncbi:HPr family phosphocarrier protein [Clostridiaceae bacterium 35-E11]
MIALSLKINNKSGLHARAATLLVTTASKYQAEIIVKRGEREANAKSILNIMSLGAMQNDNITLKINGSDEQEAALALQKLFASNFGE